MKKRTQKLLLEIIMIMIGIFGCTDSEGEAVEDTKVNLSATGDSWIR